MEENKKEILQKEGWKVGDMQEFLNLSDDKMKEIVLIKETKSMGKCVQISSLEPNIREQFTRFLIGQTQPIVSGDSDPNDWAYAHDWERFLRENKKKVIFQKN